MTKKPLLANLAAVLFFATALVYGSVRAAEAPEVRKHTFRADTLVLDRLVGRVQISVTEGPEVQLRLRGSEKAVEAIKARMQGRTLLVEQHAAGTGIPGISVVHIGDGESSLTIGSGVSQISIGSVRPNTAQGDADVTVIQVPREELEILVTLPPGMPVTLKGLVGDAKIGHTRGPIRVNVDAGDVAIGHVADAVIEVAGSGDIEVDGVDGTLDVLCAGSGSVKVAAGQISKLDVQVDGACDVRIDARAEEATLTLNGAGDIHVAEVTNQPWVNNTGAGHITVGNW